MFIIANTVLAQSGTKYADGGNILTDMSRLGSNNYADINFYTNSQKQMVLTKDGNLNLFGQSRFYKNSVFDSLLTAFAIRVQAIQANSLTVIYNAQIDGLLTVGSTLNFDGSNQTISSTTGIINFSDNTLTTTGTITADTINSSGASISNLTAGNITATGIQTQTINTGELLINGLPPQIGDTINVNVVNAGNIVIDGSATKIYSTSGVIDFNNNNIKNVGKLTVSQLGINTTNPIASMQVSGTDELNTTIGLIRYSDDDRSSRLSFVKYRGTMANPKSVLSGDRLGIISYHGFDGVQFQSSDMIKGVATENFNPTGRGSKIEFSTTPNGSTTDHIALILDNDQTASFANTVYAPNIVISDKIITKEAEFDSLRINEKLYATGSFNTDTVHANKELTINNSLKITKEDINNYAEMSTKDTAVTLVLQKEEAAEVIIGRKDSVALPQPGQEKDKLTVVGNTRLQGDVSATGKIDIGSSNTIRIDGTGSKITSTTGLIDFGSTGLKTTGALNVGNLTAQQLNVDSTTFGELVVNRKIKVGNNSLILQNDPGGNYNSIYTQGITQFEHLYIQSTDDDNNTIINGLDNHGKVGIGVGETYFEDHEINEKVTIRGNLLIEGDDGFTTFLNSNDEPQEAALYLGDHNHYIKSIYGGGLRIGTFEADNAIMLMQSNGYVGFGTENPQKNIHILSKSLSNADATIRLDNFEGVGHLPPEPNHHTIWDIKNNSSLDINFGGGPIYVTPNMITKVRIIGVNNKTEMHLISTSNFPSILWTYNENYSYGFGIGSDNKGHIFHNIGSPNSIMTFTSDGNVGIGTACPDAKLCVKGVIKVSEEVIIETNSWCDYVFEDSYKLLPLSEVEKYLIQNHHLPEIPSAKTVEEDGISLLDMNKKLLKKVEELTLYIIEQEKRIQKLESAENRNK